MKQKGNKTHCFDPQPPNTTKGHQKILFAESQ